jgi:hypothetical protein
MIDSGMGFGLSAPANERADTRLHSRADLVKRSALLGGPVLAAGGFEPHLPGRRWEAVVADARRRVLRQEQADRFREPHVWTRCFWHQRALGGADRLPASGYVGIQGTDRPDLLPGRVSHGYIRMRNGDILRLSRLMPVGTPITIR